MKKMIITDIDNSVISFPEHFENWAESKGYQIKRGVISHTYDFQDMFHEEINISAMLADLFDCDYTMGNFPALTHAVEPIKRLRAKGYDFVAVTACDPREGLAQVRHENLKNLFGFDFEEVHLTGVNNSKADVLKDYPPSFWVEDNAHHAIEGAAVGHTAFLLDYTYNRNATGNFTRVRDWYEIEERIDAM